MKLLREHKLYAKLRKCDFYKDKIHYLGHIISYEGISVDLVRIEAIMSWPTPRKVIDVKSFVELAGYYRRLTEGYPVGKFESMYGLRRPTCELVDP